ncbi:Curli biogenesis system outer membrane secretion channel CsgG [Marinobacter sp. LV10R510-11A]|uniref:CsgG/HfaB family protein n=1 Tax=Marinobacter sp. LV10R510-11A TaxID=1415568 RepID=UPI000BB7A7EA|nr:CsgG/HfaB family protein [Marinobacter sp. LV10R510-11A]SOB74746.1 Curli biogenesis system outer membrane secretion channel CsgG [Marinobacter sp. LV10R510-11A]
MKKILSLTVALTLTGCATQTPQMQDVEPGLTAEQQRAAQLESQEAAAPEQLALKRKIAVGRLSNETNYGRSLLRQNAEDKLGGKVTDMFLQALTNSDSFLVFERPDVSLLQKEASLSGQEIDIVGVDTLVIGSLTQFGRATTGERGFLSSSKKQEATATVDIRLVDVKTGRVFESVTGSGSSSTEYARTMGFGSAAGYDGSLNDQAIAAAVTAAVDKMTRLFMDKPWTADLLAQEDGMLFISGGESQGVKPNMVFDIEARGREVKSNTTGTTISLPGKKVAEINVMSLFGEDVLNQGAATMITSGSIDGYKLNELQVKEQK